MFERSAGGLATSLHLFCAANDTLYFSIGTTLNRQCHGGFGVVGCRQWANRQLSDLATNRLIYATRTP
jgi:hypothetical protein